MKTIEMTSYRWCIHIREMKNEILRNLIFLLKKKELIWFVKVSNMWWRQKFSRLRCLLRVKGLVIGFYLGWSGSILQFRQNIIKVGSKSWLLTCSSNITLSLPSYTGSALKRELNFCNGYLSLLYFCCKWCMQNIGKCQLCNCNCFQFFLLHQVLGLCELHWYEEILH